MWYMIRGLTGASLLSTIPSHAYPSPHAEICRTQMRHRHETGTTDRIGASTGRTHSFTAISYLYRGCNWHSQLHKDRAIFNAFRFDTLLGLTKSLGQATTNAIYLDHRRPEYLPSF